MSQIPPNSVPPGGQSPDPLGPGWHPDPAGRHEYRYWDGAYWTEHVVDGGVESVDPLTGGVHTPQPPPASGTRPVRAGPAPGLLVSVAILAAAMIIGVAIVATRDGGESSTTSTTTETTSGDQTTTSGTSEDTSQSGIVDALAVGVLESSDGAVTRDEADCIAEGMVDVLGPERILEVSQDPGGDAFAALTSDEQTVLATSMLQCVDAETLAEIGADPNA
jgi:hypothetical protein